jgi:hypothetical protein
MEVLIYAEESVSMDNTKKFKGQEIVAHNRWHPDIPAAVSIEPGEVFRANVREWFECAIRNDDLGLLVRPTLGCVGDLVVPVFRSSRDAETNCQVCRGHHDPRGDSYRLASGLLAAQRLP